MDVPTVGVFRRCVRKYCPIDTAVVLAFCKKNDIGFYLMVDFRIPESTGPIQVYVILTYHNSVLK